MRRIRFGYANTMATIAVFIALGGTSYAVVKLPRNSVGNLQLKANAVTSAKVRNASIARGDLAASARVGSRGARGPAGPAGTAGDRGPAGIASVIVRTRDDNPARPGFAGGSYVTVTSAALPAGRWLVYATTGVYSNATVADNLRCFVVVDGVRRGLGKVNSAGNATSGVTSSDVSLVEVVDKPSAAGVALSCGHDSDLAGSPDIRFDRAKLVAIPVEGADVKEMIG